MTLDWITTPISDDAPSGPDLWTDDDPSFSQYYYNALERIPEGSDYAKIGLATGSGNKAPDQIFDPKSVKLDDECAAIDGLLKRSHDLRLLVLRTQWSLLAAEMSEAVASVTAIADVLETEPNTAHPSLADGPRDRLDAINDLCQVGPMILPLRYLQVGTSGTSLRRLRVARGEFTPHDGEDELMEGTLVSALAQAADDVEVAFDLATDFKEALSRIHLACLSNDTPHTPQLSKINEELDDFLKMLAEAKPDLAEELNAGSDDTPADAATSSSGGTVTQVVTPVTEVLDHEDARKRLVAVETYFALNEPSSAAVLLVTQARLLIGKTLIDAFDTLMPLTADRAKVAFISDNGFQLSHTELSQLAKQVEIDEDAIPPKEMSEDVGLGEDDDPEVQSEELEPETQPDEDAQPEEATDDTSEDADTQPTDDETETEEDISQAQPEVEQSVEPEAEPIREQSAVYTVANAVEAGNQILAVETYFRAVEKSSPIPLLLARARSYIGKDFESLLKEIVPPMT